jgi:nucleotide-binding universal stress UspA family protein
MVLVGPHVRSRRGGPVLVAALPNDHIGGLLVPTTGDWARSFDAEPWFVQVTGPAFDGASPTLGTGPVHRAAEKLREQGIAAQWDVLHDGDVADGLIGFTRARGGGVIVVASERWADPHRVHWASTARALVHRSPFPVLVVPVHDALVS